MEVKISNVANLSSPENTDRIVISRNVSGGWATKALDLATVKNWVGADAQSILTKLKTVDGAGSGLNADLLDGHDSTYFAQAANLVADQITYDNASSGLTATQVQAALDEIDTAVDSITNNAVRLRGTWDASTGSFPSGADNGDTYIVSTGGTVDGVAFKDNDRILAITDGASTSTYSGNWLKLDYTDQVLSVAGKTGAVTLSSSDLTDSGTLAYQADLFSGSYNDLTNKPSIPSQVSDLSDGAQVVKTNETRQYTKQQNFAAQTLTDGANISWNLNLQQAANVTLGGDRTLDNPVNMVDGGTYTLVVKQDATGGRSLGFGSAYKWPAGSAPQLTSASNAVDILTFISDGTNMYGVAQNAFS